ncbi:MAG: transglycosylase SLT domain-containing protein [Pseudomonadales bacterium]|nr:transglycosylase SLT domain-containing protein [Pseudomonadales bacterium]
MIFSSYMKNRRLDPRLLGLLALLLASELAVAVELARPPGLAPDIDFWRRVFAEVSNDEGLVHDDQRLDIVYEIVRLPDNHTNADRRQVSGAATRKYADLLSGLAKGKRTGLSPDERRILALWGQDVDNRTLAAASQRVRFQLGQADRFRAGLVRSGRWERFIERTLAQAGVPAELIALPHVESAYDPGARSHVGAAGLWQFMPGTAKDYMRLDAVVDERMDPYRATEAAARLLRHNYGVTGSWPTAITAYNHGAGGMRRAISQLGTDDIEAVVRRYRGPAFGFASRNFYVSFLAAADVRANAERYFGKLERESPDPSQVLELPHYAPVDALEEILRIDRQTLARHNPSLQPIVWSGGRHVPRGHRLYLPPRPGLDPLALLAAAPADRWASAQQGDQYHVVRPGETLSTIAPRYGARVTDLVALNRLGNANSIRAGQRLALPASRGSQGASVATASAAAARAPVVAVRMVDEAGHAKPATVLPASVPPATAPPATDLALVYAVAPGGSIRVFEGESLGLFAGWLGVGVERLRSFNGLAPNASLKLGATLKLPFERVTQATFEARRVEHHRRVREAYHARHRIEGTHEHLIRPGESAWLLAERRYRIPVWLLRDFNPELDLNAVRPGTRIVIPRVARATG